MRILSFARILFSLRKLPNPHNQQNLENFYKYGSCYYFKPEACANFYICKPEDLLHFTGSRSEPFSGIQIIFSRDAPAIWLLWKPFNRLSGIRLFLCLLNYSMILFTTGGFWPLYKRACYTSDWISDFFYQVEFIRLLISGTGIYRSDVYSDLHSGRPPGSGSENGENTPKKGQK